MGLTLHVNHLPADDSHEISSFFYRKSSILFQKFKMFNKHKILFGILKLVKSNNSKNASTHEIIAHVFFQDFKIPVTFLFAVNGLLPIRSSI